MLSNVCSCRDACQLVCAQRLRRHRIGHWLPVCPCSPQVCYADGEQISFLAKCMRDAVKTTKKWLVQASRTSKDCCIVVITGPSNGLTTVGSIARIWLAKLQAASPLPTLSLRFTLEGAVFTSMCRAEGGEHHRCYFHSTAQVSLPLRNGTTSTEPSTLRSDSSMVMPDFLSTILSLRSLVTP